MRTLTVYRAKLFFLGAILITACSLASFSRLTRAQSPALQTPSAEAPTVKQISDYRTWQRVNSAPQFVLDGANS